jgi:ATP/maltotriose-dependent transcriptional regulator MalT
MAKTEAFPIHAIDRPSLRHQLDEVLDRPLGLITAPAGAGKSVLLAQWTSSHPELDVVSLTIDPNDDDPVRFCERLLGGLGVVDSAFVELSPLVSMSGGGLGRPLVGGFVTRVSSRTALIA